MTYKQVIITLALLILAFLLGWITKPQKAVEPSIIERTDTVWNTIHDTCFYELERRITRHDTVLLARVDTLLTRDSVLVEVPIARQEWAGENYNITTEGYNVALKEVNINVPTIEKEVTKTVIKRKHWTGGIGVQAGYGITLHGMSPYAGVGVTWGYSF